MLLCNTRYVPKIKENYILYRGKGDKKNGI